jgi:hypothetical protein
MVNMACNPEVEIFEEGLSVELMVLAVTLGFDRSVDHGAAAETPVIPPPWVEVVLRRAFIGEGSTRICRQR